MAVFSKNRKDGTAAWYYDFMHNGNRYRGVGGTTKTQALRAQEKFRADVINGNHDLPTEKGKLKIEEYVKLYLSRRQHLRSKRRDEISANNLLVFFPLVVEGF